MQTDKRSFIACLAGSVFVPPFRLLGEKSAPPELPTEVAGVRIPDTKLAQHAAELSRRSCPEFLFNHCMRTFLFGAAFAARHQITYDAEAAFVAAALHDLGLLPAFASSGNTFEVDGADAAGTFLQKESVGTAESNAVWNAIAMHALRRQIVARQAGEVLVVSSGAGADFAGPDPDDIDRTRVDQIVAAFPRLRFKAHFLELLTDHCRRKPNSQRATWLEGFCHATAPQPPGPSVADALAQAPFAE
ncbi:MAG TPA: hypothetical protein VGI20_09980 [Rhizomicrobium sp.]